MSELTRDLQRYAGPLGAVAADAIEKLEAENAALKEDLAAVKNAAWRPPILIEGATYESKTHGFVTYVGEDRYMGQLTFMFSSPHGLVYWLPETLKDHLSAAPGASPQPVHPDEFSCPLCFDKGPQPSQARDTCEWTLDDDESGTWSSSCGELWSFIDGGPKENRVTYCHHCGKLAAINAKGASHE